MASQEEAGLPKVDLSKPRYDQKTFVGRAKHFFETVNPFNIFVSSKRLEEAATLVKQYKNGVVPPGTTEDQLWEAKRLYDSAYHPDTGEKMFLLGRMSFQVPGNMTITGCMMTFYRTAPAVIFWQWINQSFNAIVNYTNRSGDENITMKQLAVPYVAATTAATVTALVLNVIVAKRLPPLVGRFVPFAAVAAGNCVNLPIMRQRLQSNVGVNTLSGSNTVHEELKYGIPVTDQNDGRVGMSTRAARKGITQVVFSRIGMAMPGMVLPPFAMNALESRGVFVRMPWLNAPLQVILVGCCLVFATPLCCAIFPQQSSISVSRLEPHLRHSLQESRPDLKTVTFNKGL